MFSFVPQLGGATRRRGVECGVFHAEGGPRLELPHLVTLQQQLPHQPLTRGPVRKRTHQPCTLLDRLHQPLQHVRRGQAAAMTLRKIQHRQAIFHALTQHRGHLRTSRLPLVGHLLGSPQTLPTFTTRKNSSHVTQYLAIFTTSSDNQDQITIALYRGSVSLVKDAVPLGKFRIAGIAPMGRGEPQVEITLATRGRALLLEAKELSTSQPYNIALVEE